VCQVGALVKLELVKGTERRGKTMDDDNLDKISLVRQVIHAIDHLGLSELVWLCVHLFLQCGEAIAMAVPLARIHRRSQTSTRNDISSFCGC
jgi:hypothetical protein